MAKRSIFSLFYLIPSIHDVSQAAELSPLQRLLPAHATAEGLLAASHPFPLPGFRCNGRRAARSESAQSARDILDECSLASFLQRTVTTRPAESERELAFVNTMCELDSGNRDSS